MGKPIMPEFPKDCPDSIKGWIYITVERMHIMLSGKTGAERFPRAGEPTPYDSRETKTKTKKVTSKNHLTR